jgi:hypothetical protein
MTYSDKLILLMAVTSLQYSSYLGIMSLGDIPFEASLSFISSPRCFASISHFNT